MAEVNPITTNSDEEPQPLSGTIAGRFIIGDRLGQGGMGEVYRAEDNRLKRTVALKRLAPSLRADATYRRRFRQESERVSRFSDSHIAAVYDILEAESEIFLVMEYVEGENLRQRLRRPMTLEQFFQIATQCAEALSAAHERAIVHCDIKPENIMLTTNGQVKILDFGVAKYLPRSDQSSTVERTGTVGGTTAYMAPEVLLENLPDGRADIFSLGVVFYEMLTAHHPFLAGSFVATSDRIRHETPTPIRIFNRKVPESLEAIVVKAMAKEPEQRYATADKLLEDLRLLRAGVTPSKLSPVLPSPRPRTNRTLLAAIAVILLVIGAYGIYRWLHQSPILAERGWVLITDFDSRGDDPIPDAGVREGLTIALQQSRYVNVFPRARVYDVLQRMRRGNVTRIDENLGREICQRENLQVLLTGSIGHLGNAFQITVRALDPVHGTLLFAEKERFGNKEEFFEKADALAKRARKDLGESLTRIEATSRPLAKVTTRSLEALQLYSQAKDAMDQGKLGEALVPLQGALHLDPEFAMAHLQLGQSYGAVVGRNENALAELKHAYDLRQSVTERERLWIESTYFSYQERYEDSAQSLNVLVSLYPDDTDAHLALAEAYDDVARTDKTIAELREVLRLNPQSASAYARLLIYLVRSNANDEAMAAYREASGRGLHSPELEGGLGWIYLGQGNVAQAREQFRKVEESGQLYQDLGEYYLAKADLFAGSFASACTHLEAVMRRAQQAHTKGLQPVSHFLLGRSYLLLGQPVLARHEAKQIMATPEADLQTVDVVSAAVLYARAGAVESARKLLPRLERANRGAPTAWNKRSLVMVQGEIALAENRPRQAVAAFVEAENTYPQASNHLGLALAYDALHDWRHAVEQWQHVLQARGEILQEEFPADWVLAHLQLARINDRLGDKLTARLHYEEFLRHWQHGDDIDQKRAAVAELRAMVQH